MKRSARFQWILTAHWVAALGGFMAVVYIGPFERDALVAPVQVDVDEPGASAVDARLWIKRPQFEPMTFHCDGGCSGGPVTQAAKPVVTVSGDLQEPVWRSPKPDREWIITDDFQMIEAVPWNPSTDDRDREFVPQPVLPAPTEEDAVASPLDQDYSMASQKIGLTVPKSVKSCLPRAATCGGMGEASGLQSVDSGGSSGDALSRSERPQSGRPQSGAEVSLRVAFETYLLPSLDGRRASKTTSSYFTSLGHWERFHSQHGSTGSTPVLTEPTAANAGPPISQISDQMLNEFGEWLMVGEAPLSLSTADNVWKNIRAILRRVGPRESGNPKAIGILDRVPTMDPLSELLDDDDSVIGDGAADVTDAEIEAIYAACEIANWPAEAAPLQWRTYLVLLSVMGPRVNDAATLTAEHFRMDARSPVRRSTRRHEDGWLVYLPTKTKGKKRTRLIVPLPPVVRRHVDALLRQRGGQLFTWRNSRSKEFAAHWQQIVDHAGLAHVERRHMRSVANLRWSRAGANASVRDDLGKWVLGHAARDVNESHYTRIEPDLIAAVPVLEVPRAFESDLHLGPIQGFLF